MRSFVYLIIEKVRGGEEHVRQIFLALFRGVADAGGSVERMGPAFVGMALFQHFLHLGTVIK
jgi:hypothetical protein